MPKIRVSEEAVSLELYGEIEKCVKRYKKHPHDFSAMFELVPDPRGKKYGHYFTAKVTYENGELHAPKGDKKL